MNKEQIEKAKMTNDQLGSEELGKIEEDVSGFKRYLEVITMIPGAVKEEAEDNEAFRKRYGFVRDYREDAWPFLDAERQASLNGLSNDEYMEIFSETTFRYIQFINNKIYFRDLLFNKLCVPKNEQMKKWRARQIERSKAVLGSGYTQLVHMPVTFELTDGCSVGCEFCAIGAKKLKSIFRYTDEHAKLFDGILDKLIEIIGPASCSGALYYGSEPLDNPDYEKFAEAVYKKSGMWPQITTAIPLRSPGRMHELIKELETKPATVYRFSVKSIEEAEAIWQEFTPRELMRVELLPQYKEAPSFAGFADSGRAKENGLADGKNAASSICCISGFVINLGDKSVRLITPISADERFPTGEVIFERTGFETAEDLGETIERMIKTYMVNEFPKDKKLKLYPCFEPVSEAGTGTFLKSPGYALNLSALTSGNASRLIELLEEGKYTESQIADILAKECGNDPVDTYWLLRVLWSKGVLDEFGEIA